MTQTTYYEFNTPEGTDLVNPLVDTNPNWVSLDAILHDFNGRSIATCNEIVSLGVHAISRLDTTAKFLMWIATANFTAGDTFTVDGLVVAASTPAGATLQTNAYVAGSVVLACLNADNSAMTIFVSGTTVADDSQRLGGELPSFYGKASEVADNTTDISNLQGQVGNTSIVGIGDGTCTGAIDSLNQILNSSVILDVNIDTSKITPNSADYFKKLSNLVYIQFSGAIVATLAAFTPHQLGTINNYKPIQDVLAPVVFATGATGALLINTSGQISIVPNGTISIGDTMYCQTFYLLK